MTSDLGKWTEKLLSVGGQPLGLAIPPTVEATLTTYGRLGGQIIELLRRKNGFYAFEAALHGFPASAGSGVLTLDTWNSFDLWRREYEGLTEGLYFFAEDAFGDQFCLRGQGICSFSSETGEVTELCSTVEEWARMVLQDYEALTGYPLMHEWQMLNGAIADGTRLFPKTPFALGGKFELANMSTIAAVSGMRTRGNLARQIRDLPDGARVEFRIIE